MGSWTRQKSAEIGLAVGDRGNWEAGSYAFTVGGVAMWSDGEKTQSICSKRLTRSTASCEMSPLSALTNS
jgi:hypothetical protein